MVRARTFGPALIPQVLVEKMQQSLPRIFVDPGLTFRRAARHVGTFGNRVNPNLSYIRGGHERPHHAMPGILLGVVRSPNLPRL